MKKLFLISLWVLVFSACLNKTDLKPAVRDTLNLAPPAALDTLQLQPRPADSLLRTKHF